MQQETTTEKRYVYVSLNSRHGEYEEMVSLVVQVDHDPATEFSHVQIADQEAKKYYDDEDGDNPPDEETDGYHFNGGDIVVCVSSSQEISKDLYEMMYKLFFTYGDDPSFKTMRIITDENDLVSEKDYIDYLNVQWSYDDIMYEHQHLIKDASDKPLAEDGQFGTLLHKNDPETFASDFAGWKQNRKFLTNKEQSE